MKEKFFAGLNTFLMWNTFFVLLSFLWFITALIGRTLDIPLGFEIWINLWDLVFTPAIGLLMGGAIVNGLYSWITKRLTQSKS